MPIEIHRDFITCLVFHEDADNVSLNWSTIGAKTSTRSAILPKPAPPFPFKLRVRPLSILK
jgi:hypothetical protein